MLIRFLLLAFTLVFCVNFNDNNTDKFQKLKNEIDFIGRYHYSQSPELNIDSLSQVTAENLTDFLLEKELTESESDSLGLRLSINSPAKNSLKIYNFGYDCGGTRSYITHPVLQWKNNKNELFAYNFSKNIKCYFNEIYKLNHKSKQLYLLIGQERGSGACQQNIVYVIEIKGDYLIIDNPVFINRAYVNLCNVSFEFNEEKQKLIGTELFNGGNNLIYAVKNQGKYSDSEKDNQKLVKLLGGLLFIEKRATHLSFNGTKFEKIKLIDQY